MRVRQHIPNYCDFEPKSAEVKDTEELLALDWVQRFAKTTLAEKFHRFVNGGIHGQEYLLMAEYNEGNTWWVVAYCSEAPDLPKWEGRK